MTTLMQDDGRRSVAEINIIPLADVLLVLLIIFMVTAPVASRTIAMDLPRPAHTPPQSPMEIGLRIDAAGDVYRDGQLIPAASLEAMLRTEARNAQAHETHATSLLRVEASDAADYQAVAAVLAAAQNAGFPNIALRKAD